MVYALSYRRPTHVGGSASSSWAAEDKDKFLPDSIRSGKLGASAGIPDALSFDRIVDGGTCPPCTLREFMDYLLHIELAAENLQFYLWYRDYCNRFAEAPESERVLAPRWSATQAEVDKDVISQAKGPPKLSLHLPETLGRASMELKETDIPPAIRKATVAPPSTAGQEDGSETLIGSDQQTLTRPSHGRASSQLSSYGSKETRAFETVDLLYEPFTIQPFRTEIGGVIATYLVEDAPRQLNLSSRERTVVLRALGYTTHPSALSGVATTVEYVLRRQAHPNFIRWVICNGNRPRVIFAQWLGINFIALAFLAAAVLVLSKARPGWRALTTIGWFLGVATLVAGCKGLCVVLHGLHHRQLRPWELFKDDDDEEEVNGDGEMMIDYQLSKQAFYSSGPSNSYENEPWVAKYEKRNLLRKIFDREVWIQEPALRQIQDTIFLQALAFGLLAAALFTVGFVLLPKGNFF